MCCIVVESFFDAFDHPRCLFNDAYYCLCFFQVGAGALVFLNSFVGGKLALVLSVGGVAAHLLLHQPSVDSRSYSAVTNVKEKVNSKIDQFAKTVEDKIKKL